MAIVDDRDAAVTYAGTWVNGGSQNEHAGTVKSSNTAGDRFSVAFTGASCFRFEDLNSYSSFTIGTSIAVFGTYDSSSVGVVTSYAIDGGAAQQVTSRSSPNDSYKQQFWKSNTLPAGAQ